MKKKKIIIIISIIVLLLVISSIILTVVLGNKKKQNNQEAKINIQELENNFNTIFTNTIYPETEENKEKVYLKYNIETSETGKYKINTKLPIIEIESEVVEEINNDIFISFVKPIGQILDKDGAYTIYNADYASFLNDNILSIIIKCTLKEGSNPQRVIIRTYNYDMENDQNLEIKDIIRIKNLNQEEIENKIFEKINNEIQKINAIKDSGYNVYKRDINSEIYKLENIKEFFLGENNLLYIVYPYGNREYTSEVDLVICE